MSDHVRSSLVRLPLLVWCAAQMFLVAMAEAQGKSGLPQEHERQSYLQLRAKNFKGAIQEFQSALRLDPKSVPAHVGLGVALRQSGDAIGSIAEFQAALQLNPNDFDAHYNLAITYGQNGNLENAKTELLRALQIEPENAEAHHHLGLLLAGR